MIYCEQGKHFISESELLHNDNGTLYLTHAHMVQPTHLEGSPSIHFTNVPDLSFVLGGEDGDGGGGNPWENNLEEITKDLSTKPPSPVISPQFAALAPALTATLASQQQQRPPSQFDMLLPILITTLSGQQQPQIATLLPLLITLSSQQGQQYQSPSAPLAPVLLACLLGQQSQQHHQPSPLVSALTAAIVPAITSALSGKFGEEEERQYGKQSQPSF